MKHPIPCQLVSWEQFRQLSRDLAWRVHQAHYRPQIIVAIGRGGYLPARLLSDFLDVPELASFRIEHYRATHKSPAARVCYPLTAPIAGQRVLLVDDVSDSGDTFRTALEHLAERGPPALVRTAVLHHKTVSAFEPDFRAARIADWRWIIYPWAQVEDLTNLIRDLGECPADVTEVRARIAAKHGILVPESVFDDVLRLMDVT